MGPADILAAFAGGHSAPTPSLELTAERWRQVLDTGLTSVFLTILYILPGMVERFSGSILTLSSSAGRQPGQANLA